MAIDYQVRLDRLAKNASELDRSVLELFLTWAELRGLDLDQALARLDQHMQWLTTWGFPAASASLHVDIIRKHGSKA